jgi:hypothetical protein
MILKVVLAVCLILGYVLVARLIRGVPAGNRRRP